MFTMWEYNDLSTCSEQRWKVHVDNGESWIGIDRQDDEVYI